MRRALAALALLALPAAAEAAPDPFAGLPDIRFVYRPIAGTDVAELSAALEASADHPPGGGSSYADTRWSINWRWRPAGVGKACRVAAVEMIFSAVVTLPRLTDPAALDPATRARWTVFERATARHEAGHVRRAHDYLPRVRRAIQASPCDEADRAGRAALRPLRGAQIAYDRETRNGATQGARFP